MCGIAGIIGKKSNIVSTEHLFAMADSLSHRGPDAEGFVLFNGSRGDYHHLANREDRVFKADIGLAHKRLSIIDLTDAAAQPMAIMDNSLWIVYNGEIFNFIEIRRELEACGCSFSTNSDTEVLLRAYFLWGKECLHKFNGMWAFTIYDLRKNKIFCARDRFGIKPFYYHQTDRYFVFASEIKALLELPWVSREPFLPVIKNYLYYSRVNTSKYTFFKDINELQAGHYLEIDLNYPFKLKPQRWWDISENLQEPPTNSNDVFENLRDLLISSIKLRLRSDVPIGTCLSGGLDSSSIVCLAAPYLSKSNQKTFSIVQPGFEFDESRFIDVVLHRTNVKAFRKELSGRDIVSDLPLVIRSHDEPFTSTSMYAQWKVFQLAKSHGVKVTLDGQGADELLAGYSYFKPVFWFELLCRGNLGNYFKEINQSSNSPLNYGLNFIMSLGGILTHRNMFTAAGILDHQYRQDWINRGCFKKINLPSTEISRKFRSGLTQRLYEVFSSDGLPALIRYADRNSMIHSLESRMPFLDYRLVTFLFSLSSSWKIQKGINKYVLRESLRDDLPEKIRNRKDKIGFVTPEKDWFRHEMSDYIEQIIYSDMFINRGFINTGVFHELFERHKKGTIDVSRPIWRAVNLEMWFRAYID